MTTETPGRAWLLGDDVDTDQLAPGPYLKAPLDELARHCMEATRPDFASGVAPGDVVVGGRNFGLGSSREQAAQVLHHLGVAAVLANSFGGIFYRNALNFGLLALVCPELGTIQAGDRLAIDAEAATVRNLTRDESYATEPVPPHLLAMVRDGGLVPHLEKRLQQPS